MGAGKRIRLLGALALLVTSLQAFQGKGTQCGRTREIQYLTEPENLSRQ